MSDHIVSATIVVAASGGLLLLYKLCQIGQREDTLPPGPPTAPLLGNLLIFPRQSAHLQFTKWAKQYGDVFSLKLANKTAIIISSASAVRDLMEKNSALTADRPRIHMAHEITSGGTHMVLTPYNENWKKFRRSTRDVLTAEASARHLPIQHAETAQLMNEILTSPTNFFTSIRRYSFSVIMSVLFGKRNPQFDNPEVKTFYHFMEMFENILEPGAHPPVDLIPILKKVPERFAPWKTLCKEVRRLQQGLYFGLLKEVEDRMDRGESNGCWMEAVVDRAEELNMDRTLVGHLGGSLIEGGAETKASIMLSLILFMVAYPEAQKKAQEEIDRVIGFNRVPTHDDFQNLPYIQAIIQETLRFRPVAPLLVPHASSGDVMYKNYVIPSGAIIFVNAWGIFHDEYYFENPSVFNPDRFLENKFGVRKEVVHLTSDWKEDLSFGCGRRFCPGVHIGKHSLALNTMNLLWGFNFSKATNPSTGAEIEPDLWNYAKGNLLCPNPFDCTITPRSAQHASLIRQEYQAATAAFLPFEHELSDQDRRFVEKERAAF